MSLNNLNTESYIILNKGQIRIEIYFQITKMLVYFCEVSI